MRPDQLPARLWRRRYLRILASRQRKREAARMRQIKAAPVHPAHERWLRYQAVGDHRCRPYVFIVDDPPPRYRGAEPSAADVTAWYKQLKLTSYVAGPVEELCLRCGCQPGRRDHGCPNPCHCHDSGNGVS